jgi:hypothetical protein
MAPPLLLRRESMGLWIVGDPNDSDKWKCLSQWDPKKKKKRKAHQDDSTEAEVTKKSPRRLSFPTKVDPIAQMIEMAELMTQPLLNRPGAWAWKITFGSRNCFLEGANQDRIMGSVEGIFRLGAALVKDIFGSKREKRRDGERWRDSDHDDDEEELK